MPDHPELRVSLISYCVGHEEAFMPRRVGGFTLIELMIVVAIIGVLASIAIPNFIKFQAKSKQAEARTNLKALAQAEMTAIASNGAYMTMTGAGFIPDRGNRYWYRMNAIAVASQDRSTATLLDPTTVSSPTFLGGGYDSVDVDCFRIAGGLAGCVPQPPRGGISAPFVVPTVVPDLGIINTPTVPGTSYAPGDAAVVEAIGNVDSDIGADTWTVSLSATINLQPGPCSEASQAVSGTPANSWNDVACD
jgi:type IV pilus assembly protein PilA